MKGSCLHTHTLFCDGKADVESMCAEAARIGLQAIGFSAHAPLPELFPEESPSWHLPGERLGEYARTVREARERWSGRLDVFLGLEIDYIRGRCGPADGRFDSLGLDYSIGSLHYLFPENGSKPFTVDGSREEWEAGADEGYDGDPTAVARAYWKAMAEMAEAGGFDIIGHLDLVKKNNRGGRRFDEKGPAYREAAMEAIEAIARGGFIVEVNTGGMNRGSIAEAYPASWMLDELRSRSVRVIVAADAHAPSHLGGYYEEARGTLRAAGYSTEVGLVGRKIWKDFPL